MPPNAIFPGESAASKAERVDPMRCGFSLA
jgi:hypothetical protein